MINYAKKGVVVAATVLTLSGCGESSSSSTGSDFQSSDSGQTTTPAVTEFDEAQLVANLVDNVITPTFVLFNQQAQTQTQAVANYCQAEIQSVQESSEEAIALRAQAQQAWLDTMAGWQQAEMMQMEPLLDNAGKFAELHTLLGEAPLLTDAYKAQLVEARDLMQEVYGFDAQNVENW